jgi:hypothetical protein
MSYRIHAPCKLRGTVRILRMSTAGRAFLADVSEMQEKLMAGPTVRVSPHRSFTQ